MSVFQATQSMVFFLKQPELREVVPHRGLNMYILDYLIFLLAVQILVVAHWIFNLLLVSACELLVGICGNPDQD